MWIAHRTVLRAAAESWHAVPELRAVWLVAAAEFTDALAGEIARDRRERRLAAEPRQLAALVLWTLERNLYVAGLKIDEGLPPRARDRGAAWRPLGHGDLRATGPRGEVNLTPIGRLSDSPRSSGLGASSVRTPRTIRT